MFLKLDGVRGESKFPRHSGEIEIASLMWGGRHQQNSGSGTGRGKALINDLTVTKQTDKTSPILMIACSTGQNFPEGILTIEDISETGNLLRAVILNLKSILVDSVTADNSAETATLNVESAKVMFF